MPDPINLVGFFFVWLTCCWPILKSLQQPLGSPGVANYMPAGSKSFVSTGAPKIFVRGELARQIDGLARSMRALNHGLAGKVRAKLSG